MHEMHAQARAHTITAYIFLIYFYKFILPKLNEIHWQIFVLPNIIIIMTNLHIYTNISHLNQNFKVTFMHVTKNSLH